MATKTKRKTIKPKLGRPKSTKRGEVHMSVRVHNTDKKAFGQLCKKNDVPQVEMFRRFVAAFGRASKKTKVVTIRITGYSPL